MRYVTGVFIILLCTGCNQGLETVQTEQTSHQPSTAVVGGPCEYKSTEVNATVTFLNQEHAVFEAEQEVPREIYLFKENRFELKSSEYEAFDTIQLNHSYTLYFDLITQGTCTPNIFKKLEPQKEH